MADNISQGQPSWITALVQGLLGKIGLGNAPGQAAAPGIPSSGAAPNPWVQGPNANTANPPGTPQATDTSYLKGIIDAQQALQNKDNKPTKSTAPGKPTSSLMDIFHSLIGNA